MSDKPKYDGPDWRGSEQSVLEIQERLNAFLRYLQGAPLPGDEKPSDPTQVMEAFEAESAALARAHHAWVIEEESKARDAFLRERIEELPEQERSRGTETIEGRLLAAVAKRPPWPTRGFSQGGRATIDDTVAAGDAADIDAKVEAGDTLVRAALADLWADVERQARAGWRWPHMPIAEAGNGIDQAIANQPGPFFDAATGLAPRTMGALEHAQPEWIHPGLEHRVSLALVWPEVLAAWRSEGEQRKLERRQSSEQHRKMAQSFVEGAVAKMALRQRPDATGIAALSRRLVERELTFDGPRDLEDLRPFATSNPALKAAIADLDSYISDTGRHPREPEHYAWRMGFAFHWPAIFEEWRSEHRPGSLARMPTALVTGRGAIAPLFGRSLPGDAKAAWSLGSGGKVEKIRISRSDAQLDLLVKDHIDLVSPTQADVLDKLAQVLSNREWRFFAAALVAANDDYQSGVSPTAGGFYFLPRRFADLLGLHDREAVRKLDACVAAFMGISMTATVKAAGKSYKLTAEQLLVDGKGTIAEAGKRGRGRPSARLYRIQDSFLALLSDGASWFPITRAMLKPPEGVDPRTWDDAFKLETVLAALARGEASKVYRPGLAWKNKTTVLLDAAGITGRSLRKHEKLERLVELLEVLKKTGRLEYQMDGACVRYDLPTLRPALVAVAKRKSSKSLNTGLPTLVSAGRLMGGSVP